MSHLFSQRKIRIAILQVSSFPQQHLHCYNATTNCAAYFLLKTCANILAYSLRNQKNIFGEQDLQYEINCPENVEQMKYHSM